MEIDLIELFSGIGGFALGLEQAGFKIKKHQFSEIDKHAIANYKYNFKNSEYVGPVHDVRGKRTKRPSIITFGSPCQDFSLAGEQKGLDGERSVLILEAIRIITEAKPSVFIWENVKGAFSSNSGADFWAILNAFTNIGGYRLEWQLLNTSWVLPQNRERIYLVGHLTGRSTGEVFPFTETNTGFIEGATNTPIVRAITAGGKSGGHHSGMTLVNQLNDKRNFGESTAQQDRVYCPSGIMACLSSARLENKVNIKVTNLKGKEVCNTIRGGGRGSLSDKHNWDIVKAVLTPDRKEKRQNGRRFKENGEPSFTLNCQDQHGVMISTNTKQGFDVMTEEDSLNLSVPSSKTRRGRVGKGVAQILDTQCNQGVLENTQIRRLTEIECERLQGFPDDWTRYGMSLSRPIQKYIFGNQKKWRTKKAEENLYRWAVNNTKLELKEIKKTNRYKMCGNAVTTKVVQLIGEKLNIK